MVSWGRIPWCHGTMVLHTAVSLYHGVRYHDIRYHGVILPWCLMPTEVPCVFDTTVQHFFYGVSIRIFLNISCYMAIFLGVSDNKKEKP